MSTEQKQKTPKITDMKEAFIVWTNTDLTEGRGWQYPAAVCESETTALRLAKGRGVMGSDAGVEPALIFRIDGHWYAPSKIEPSTKEDERFDGLREEKRQAEKKAEMLGMTPEEIIALSRSLQIK
jgi:hypothetical protein